jgi:hypothetical protein
VSFSSCLDDFIVAANTKLTWDRRRFRGSNSSLRAVTDLSFCKIGLSIPVDMHEAVERSLLTDVYVDPKNGSLTYGLLQRHSKYGQWSTSRSLSESQSFPEKLENALFLLFASNSGGKSFV